MLNTKLYIFTDGSVNKNPGTKRAGAAVLVMENEIFDSDVIMETDTRTTNNQAEYLGLLAGIRMLEAKGLYAYKNVEFVSDSELVVKQVTGEYECNDETLKILLEDFKIRIKHLSKKYQAEIDISWAPRNSNKFLKQANYLAQDACSVKRH